MFGVSAEACDSSNVATFAHHTFVFIAGQPPRLKLFNEDGTVAEVSLSAEILARIDESRGRSAHSSELTVLGRSCHTVAT